MSPKIILAIVVLCVTFIGGLVGIAVAYTPLAALLGNNLFILAAITAALLCVTVVFVSQFMLRLCADAIAPLVDVPGQTPYQYLNELIASKAAGNAILVNKELVTDLGNHMQPNIRGVVIVRPGTAAVMEIRGTPTRVFIQGLKTRDPFETVRAGVDLTIQTRERKLIVYTKDGVHVEALVRINFHINPGDQPRANENMYPVHMQSAIDATYLVSDWKAHSLEAALGAFRTIFANHYLNQIFDPMEKSIHGGDRIDVNHLQQELIEALNQQAETWGVQVTGVIIELSPPKEIEQQSLAFTKARSENRRVKEFMEETKGNASDYAAIQLSEAITRMGGVSPAIANVINHIIEKKS